LLESDYRANQEFKSSPVGGSGVGTSLLIVTARHYVLADLELQDSASQRDPHHEMLAGLIVGPGFNQRIPVRRQYAPMV
jgi:hypothetical protein